LALFILWEDFLQKTPDNFTTLWKDLFEALCPRLKFNVRNISLLRKSTEDAKADPKLWKSHSDGDAIVAADFEETLDNETPTEPDDILVEERDFTAFRNILQEAVRTGEATEKSPELLRMLQTTNPIAEDFHHFCGSFSTSRNGDFYNEIQRDDEQGVGIAILI
jgi:hypothetical protein